uniref:Transport and Golgi organization protein 2 n=1 Tax=Strigamia maritima TaxID=126957 RepID=T1J2R1_STRMM
MCVLFFLLNPNPSENGYKLILANNRDEYYTRPTKIADFWDNEPNIISGLDMEPGKEGGTWLGMTKTGRIGVLLNILQPVGQTNVEKKGRGFLVTDFLKSTKNPPEYLGDIFKEGDAYNSFNLVTIEINSTAPDATIGHYTNFSSEVPIFLTPGEHAFGNSRPQTPWKKIVVGSHKFTQVISKHKTCDSMNELIEDLIGILSDETTMLPDPQLESQTDGRGEEFSKKLSALKVIIPGIKYGTRTNTIIIVDSHNKATYVERTMKEPIDVNNPEWITTQHVFQII